MSVHVLCYKLILRPARMHSARVDHAVSHILFKDWSAGVVGFIENRVSLHTGN